MRFFIITALFLISASVCFAQRNPSMTGQLDDADREALYARFTENKKVPVAERQKLAYEAARDYVKRYSSEQDSRLAEMRRFVKEYERVMGNFELHDAFTAKKYPKVFELGRASLKKDPENFYVLALLTETGYKMAEAGDTSLSAETIDYAKRAIQIAESDKFTQPDPFASVADARGFLNFVLGWFLRTQSPADADAAFVQAVKSGAGVKDDPLTYNLLGIALLKEYEKAAADYNTNFGNKPPSPEQQSALQHVLHTGERAIDAYARAIALSTKPEQQAAKAKMLTGLTDFYKSLHNNSDAGLNELIAGVLSKPLPE